uniref:Secreted protein n=1 Tax=Timema monikensis TaxID=170555 RepID=A0A7R9HQC8_9NEOP|nr:unnamed protein product [Timema monikensis]
MHPPRFVKVSVPCGVWAGLSLPCAVICHCGREVENKRTTLYWQSNSKRSKEETLGQYTGRRASLIPCNSVPGVGPWRRLPEGNCLLSTPWGWAFHPTPSHLVKLTPP